MTAPEAVFLVYSVKMVAVIIGVVLLSKIGRR